MLNILKNKSDLQDKKLANLIEDIILEKGKFASEITGRINKELALYGEKLYPYADNRQILVEGLNLAKEYLYQENGDFYKAQQKLMNDRMQNHGWEALTDQGAKKRVA